GGALDDDMRLLVLRNRPCKAAHRHATLAERLPGYPDVVGSPRFQRTESKGDFQWSVGGSGGLRAHETRGVVRVVVVRQRDAASAAQSGDDALEHLPVGRQRGIGPAL